MCSLRPVHSGYSRFVFPPLLAATMGISTVALTCYAVLAPELIIEFGVARWQIGFLVAVMSLGGALVAPRIGRFADLIGAKRSTTVTAALAAFSLIGLAVAPGFWIIVVSALGGGLANALANPATNKLIAYHANPGARGVIIGIKQSGVTGTSAIAGAGLPLMASAAGWRWAVGAFALFACFVGLSSLSLPPDPVDSTATGRVNAGKLDGYISRVAIYGFVLGMAGAAIYTFLPLYAIESLGLDATTAGLIVAASGVAGVIGRILWGRFAEVHIGTWRSLEYIALLGGVAAVTMVLSAATPWLVWLAAVLAGLSVSAWNAVGMLAVVETAQTSQTGRASGVVLLGFLLGLGVGAPVFGYSVDRLQTYTFGWLAVGLASLSGFIVMRTFRDNAPPSPV